MRRKIRNGGPRPALRQQSGEIVRGHRMAEPESCAVQPRRGMAYWPSFLRLRRRHGCRAMRHRDDRGGQHLVVGSRSMSAMKRGRSSPVHRHAAQVAEAKPVRNRPATFTPALRSRRVASRASPSRRSRSVRCAGAAAPAGLAAPSTCADRSAALAAAAHVDRDKSSRPAGKSRCQRRASKQAARGACGPMVSIRPCSTSMNSDRHREPCSDAASAATPPQRLSASRNTGW